MSLKEAAKYGGNIRLFKKVESVARHLGIPRDEAHDLQLQAQDGDEVARARIREGRCSLHRERRGEIGGSMYTWSQFQSYYGPKEALARWEAAEVSVRQRRWEISESTEEKRIGADGVARSKAEFVTRYGTVTGIALWHAAGYEVLLFGAWLPLAKLVSSDVSIPTKLTPPQMNLVCRRMFPTEVARQQLSGRNILAGRGCLRKERGMIAKRMRHRGLC